MEPKWYKFLRSTLVKNSDKNISIKLAASNESAGKKAALTTLKSAQLVPKLWQIKFIANITCVISGCFEKSISLQENEIASAVSHLHNTSDGYHLPGLAPVEDNRPA